MALIKEAIINTFMLISIIGLDISQKCFISLFISFLFKINDCLKFVSIKDNKYPEIINPKFIAHSEFSAFILSTYLKNNKTTTKGTERESIKNRAEDDSENKQFDFNILDKSLFPFL